MENNGVCSMVKCYLKTVNKVSFFYELSANELLVIEFVVKKK